MKDKRPVNLDLTTIKLPITAITSIMHRISGAALFFAIPLVLLALQCSLASAEHFQHVQQFLRQPLVKIITILLTTAFIYHLLAGIKHLVMDFGLVHESYRAGKIASVLLLITATLAAVAMGVWIW